jgi:serine/threonine protein kinase
VSKPRFETLAGLEDDYDQIQKVAIGGMAEVYRGRQKNLDRSVAIKRIRDDLKGNSGIQVRFKREATKAANLLHHNLAHVYDYRVVGDEAYMIMEYIDGFDLAELLEQIRYLPHDVAAMIAVKILDGLAYVHSHAMVHRDLKPDNIRVSSRGEVKIMDFGIAWDPSEENLTQPGIIIGSPHYLSPEQVRGEGLDARSDIFAFGILFYEILTGVKPFKEQDGETVYQRIKKGKYVPIEKVRPDVPAYLRKIVENCLNTAKKDRPKKAEDIAQSLQEFLLANHTLSMDTRIKKFLMEASLLPGNPASVEVAERTLPPPGKPPFWKRLSGKNLVIVLLTLACLTLSARLWMPGLFDGVTTVSGSAEPPAPEPKELRPKPGKPRRPTRPTLPGQPVGG